MTERRFVLVDFRYTNDVVGHIRLYEAGCTYAMRRGLAHAAAKRELVATERPVDWMPPSIFRPPEVLTELETVEAENATPRFRDSRSKDLNSPQDKMGRDVAAHSPGMARMG
jgi:hypothetical protein